MTDLETQRAAFKAWAAKQIHADFDVREAWAKWQADAAAGKEHPALPVGAALPKHGIDTAIGTPRLHAYVAANHPDRQPSRELTYAEHQLLERGLEASSRLVSRGRPAHLRPKRAIDTDHHG